MERPVKVIRKETPTLLECILKIGGFIGFLKLFSSLIGFLHKGLFLRTLRQDFESSKGAQSSDINRTEVGDDHSMLLAQEKEPIETVFSFETISKLMEE